MICCVPSFVQQYQECGDSFQNQYGDVLSSALVELDMETGDMRTGIDDAPFMAQQTDLNLSLVPIVDQDYRLSFNLGSDNVSVLREGYDDLTFTLPGFEFKGDTSPYEGLVAFYSKVLDLFYFIYGDDYNDKLAVCKTDGTCDISEFSSSFTLARNSDVIAVYDSLRLVGLEVPCCLCIGTTYFAFDESGLTEFDILNQAFSPFVVDPRIGVAYAARKDYQESDIQIISETLPYFSETIPEQQSHTLDKAKLEEALKNQV